MIGTAGFVAVCVRSTVFGKAEGLLIVQLIGDSSFRVTKEVLSSVRSQIEAS